VLLLTDSQEIEAYAKETFGDDVLPPVSHWASAQLARRDSVAYNG
jgi:hypothetical protein